MRTNALMLNRNIEVGDHVLVRMKPVNKLSSAYNADPYKVIAVKGSMIAAELQGHRITRDVSFFRRLSTDDYDDELPVIGQNIESVKPPSKQPTSDQQLCQS
jgi:hypothetical protein